MFLFYLHHESNKGFEINRRSFVDKLLQVKKSIKRKKGFFNNNQEPGGLKIHC
jgi:hypothetical protein